MNHQLKQTASKSLSSLKQIRINTIQTYKQQNADFFKKMCCYNFWATISVLLQKTPITGFLKFWLNALELFCLRTRTCGVPVSDSRCGWTTFWVETSMLKKIEKTRRQPYEINECFGFCHQFEVVHRSSWTEGLSGVKLLVENFSWTQVFHEKKFLPQAMLT